MATRRRPLLRPSLLNTGVIGVLLLGGNSKGQDPQKLRVRGVIYSVDDGELNELRPGAAYHLRMPTAVPGGTGRVHDICRGPADVVFIAADRGLFSVSPQVGHLDLVGLQDGAPSPPFLGVEYVQGYRLYVLTATELACFDTRQFFARRVTGDRVGLGPFLGLSKTADGALKVSSQDGERTYEPERGPPPELELQTVNGQPFDRQRRFEVDYGSEVMVRWRTRPDASVRYRLARHHVWRPLNERGRLPALEPGDHIVLFAAFDQDLRRSQDVPLQLRVHYPPQLDKRFLVPIAALGSVSVLLLFLARARKRGGGRSAYQRAAISAVLVVVLFLQLLVALFPHGRSWPFVGFSMYTEVYHEGEHTFRPRALAVRKDGSRMELGSFAAGFSLYEWQRALVPMVLGPDSARQQFLARVQQDHPGQEFVGFVIRTDRQCLTARGPVPVAPLIMRVHPEDLLDDNR